MRTNTLIVATMFSCLLSSDLVFAADDEINQLKMAIAELKKTNDALEKSRTDEAKVRFEGVKKSIYTAVQNYPLLQAEYIEASKGNAIAGLLVRLGNATNPSSDVLGRKFKDIVIQSAESSFQSIRNNTTSWERFTNIVEKLMDNPLVASAISSNPISSVVGSIVQTAASYSEASINTARTRVKTTDVINASELNAFTTSIAPYTDFYDKVSAAASKYRFEKSALDKKYSAIAVSITKHSDDLISGLQLKPENSHGPRSLQLNPLFSKISETSNFADIENILSDPRVKKGYEESLNYSGLALSVEQFKFEYSAVLNAYLEAYKQGLVSLLAVHDLKFDKKNIEGLIDEIKAFQNEFSQTISASAAKKLDGSQLLIKSGENTFQRFDAFKKNK